MQSLRSISSKTTFLRRQFSKQSSGRKRKADHTEEHVYVEGEVLHGIFPVTMALKLGRRRFNRVFYCPESPRAAAVVDMAVEKGVEVKPVSFRNLERMCGPSSSDRSKKSVHQGVAADVDKMFPLDCEKYGEVRLTKFQLQMYRLMRFCLCCSSTLTFQRLLSGCCSAASATQ
jgi:tRNA G18 (ribose-2'-O)-methylase SpoU